MAQHVVLIDADDPAHAPEATAEDTATCDVHAEELAGSTGSRSKRHLDAALAVAGTNPVVRAGGVVEGRPVPSGGGMAQRVP